MPRGRFLSKSISLDEKVNALSDDTARLLFTWLISHLDCEGRLHGDAMTVKSIVFPRRKISERRIDKYLNEISKLGLIIRYGVNGNTYISTPNFEKHQTGLQKSKEAQSQIPPHTPELVQSKTKQTPPQVKVKVKVKVEEIYILPQWLDKNTWEAFLEMRKKKRAIPTELAIRLLIKELEKLKAQGHDPTKVLNQSIMRNYTGVFPVTEEKGGKGRRHSGQATAEQLEESIGKPLD